MNQSPLARGFCKGVAPDQAESFDRQSGHEAVMPTPSLSTQAKFYQVNTRTVSRWRAKGIDTTNPLAVGEYLLSVRHPSPSALRVIRDSLNAEIANSTH